MFDSRKINSYLSAMARRNIPASEVLANSWIKQEDLTNPDFVVDLAQSQILIHNMINLTGNQALGLELGKEITIADMGIVAYGMLTSPTMREAINMWTSYAPSLYGTMINLAIEEDKNKWHLLLSEKLPQGACYQFCMEEYLMLSLYLGKQLCGKPSILSGVEVVYPPPPHAGKYRKLLGCDVKFSMARNRISIISPKLDEPLQTKDEYLNSIYQQYCEQRAGRMVMGGAFSARVRNHLIKYLGRTPNMDQIAREMRCSSSTLRRRLLDEKVLFREIVAEFRRDLALQYFKTTKVSTKEVAYLLGYKDVKPFIRAFKSWTGMTVTDYKKSRGVLNRGM